MAAWANFGLKEGSPAVGIGDPKIPGPKNIGISGGPCADPNSSVCSSFIQSNLPTLPTPTPEQEGINREPDVTNKNESLGRGEFYKVESEVGPQQNKRTMFVKQGTLFLQNSSSDKTFKIIGLSFQGQQNVSVEKNLDKATVLQYDYSGYCGGLINEVKSGLLYSSSSDNFSSMKYKQLVLNCFRAEVVDFE
ncbi:hypothetical protein HY041_04370 [Candidatus Roizmanbacteria bacterium]|nr:hypothetical protein [Candidatus Roizmanbacteria bacterium]